MALTAGPGYGKTTLMAQLERCSAGTAIFLTFEKQDRDWRHFILRLIAEMRRLCPNFEVNLEASIKGEVQLDEDGSLAPVIAFAEEICQKLSSQFAIFLDNLEVVNDTREVTDRIRLLHDHLPCGCHCYVAGRTRPNLGLGRLRAARDVVEIGQADLQFTTEETGEFLRSASALPWLEEDIRAWHRATGGWPAALDICQRELTVAGKTAVGLLPALIKKPGALNRYLAAEIWSGLDNKRRRFFIQSSLVEPVEIDICSRAGIKTEMLPAAIDKMDAQGVVNICNEANTAFIFNPVFREFLVDKLRQSSSRSEIFQLHRNYAQAYSSAGNKDKAVHHFIEAEDFDSAAGLVEAMAASAVETGNLHLVARWLEKIPAVFKITRPWICLAQAQISFNQGDLDKSHSLVNRAAAVFGAVDSPKGLYCCALAISHMLALQNRHSESLKAAQDAQKWARESSEHAYASRRAVVQQQILGRRRIKRWRIGDQTLAFGHESPEQSRLKILLSDLDLLFLKGDFGRLLKCSLELNNKTDVESLALPYRFFLFLHLANAYYQTARYEEAYEVILKTSQSIQEPVYRPAIDCLAERIDFYSGNKSRRQEDASKIVNKNKSLDRNWAHLGTKARRLGFCREALKLHEQNFACCRRGEKLLFETVGILANVGADKFRIVGGPGGAGEAEMTAAFALARKHGYKYLESKTHFHWAWKAFQGGRDELAREQLKAALQLAASLSHHHFVAEEGRISLDLLAFAFECDIERDFLKVIFSRIGNDAVPVLASSLTDRPAAKRVAAISAVAAAGGAAAAGIIRPLLRDDDANVRAAAKKELAAIRTGTSDPLQLLTRRESQILSVVAAGLSNLEIAAKLSISEATVKRHVSNIYLKLGLNKRRQVMEYFQPARRNLEDLVLARD